jgi:hypothetical protein
VAQSKAGRYLLSFRPSDPGYSPGDSNYDGYVYMPTVYGAIDLRIQVDNTSDVQTVNAIQVKFTLQTTPTKRPQVAPTLTQDLLTADLYGSRAEMLLQLTACLSPFNPPEEWHDVEWMKSTLELAGLLGGHYTTPMDVDLLLASAEAITVIAEVSNDLEKNFHDLGNNWSTLRAHLSGDFKSHYDVHAFIAAEGYLQLTADQAMYPAFNVSYV